MSGSASPTSGTKPLNNVSVTASVSGTATGNTLYELDCRNDGFYEIQSSSISETSYTFATKCSYSSSGNYTIKVKAARQSLSETDTISISVAEPPSDLTIQSISASPSSPAPGDTITYSVVVKNQGTGTFSGGWLGGYTFNPSRSYKLF